VASGLVSLAPIYAYLRARGGVEQDEYIVFGGWPVQFLPTANELEQEAVENSVPTTVEGVRTWIMTAEHLAAIALRTGRAKDHNRVLQFVEQNAVDRNRLHGILEKHGLTRPKLQARMRALSFDEKIKILEKLRDRDKAIAASGLKRKAGINGKPNK